MPTKLDSRQIENKNYPTAAPSLVLDFANGRCLDNRITFTRASTATRVNQIGLLELVGTNVPRFNYNPISLDCEGILIEPSRTNLLLRSEELDNAAWTGSNLAVTANAAIGPNGLMSLEKLVVNNTQTSTGASHIQAVAKSAVSTTYTLSLFAKEGEWDRVRLYCRDTVAGSNSALVTYSLVDGSVVTAAAVNGTFTSPSSSMEVYPNGVYRFTLTFTTSTETSIRPQIYSLDSVATTGDGTSGIYVGFVQLETGSFATSYIKTEGTTQTRNGDSVTMTGTNFSSWFRADEGTFATNAKVPTLASAYTLVGASDGTADERIILNTTTAGGGTLALTVGDGGVTQTAVNASSISVNTFFSVVGAYKLDDFAISKNGNIAVLDTSGTLPTVDRLYIGASSTGSINMCTIKHVVFYPKRLTNDELQTISRD